MGQGLQQREVDALGEGVGGVGQAEGRGGEQAGVPTPVNALLTDTLEAVGLLVIVVDEENPGFSGLTAKAQTEDGREYPVVKNINEDAGKGVSGEVNGHAVRVGRLSFAAAGEDGFLAVGEAAPLSPRSGQLPLRGGAQQKDDLRTRFGLLQPDEMASYVSVDGRLIARIAAQAASSSVVEAWRTSGYRRTSRVRAVSASFLPRVSSLSAYMFVSRNVVDGDGMNALLWRKAKL